MLAIACSGGYRTPFVIPLDPSERNVIKGIRVKLANGIASDHLSILGAVRGFQMLDTASRYRFCRENYLSSTTLQLICQMQEQVFQSLVRWRVRRLLSFISNIVSCYVE